MSRKVIRKNLIDSVKKEIMGPQSYNEMIEKVPTQQYITGIIFPEIINEEEASDDSDDRGEKTDEDEETYTDLHLPQSIGITVIIDTEKIKKTNIEIKISGAIYKEINKNEWKRIPISKNPPFLRIDSKIAKIRFSDKRESRKISLKELEDSKGDIVDGFSLNWETLPITDDKKEHNVPHWYLSVFLVNERKSKKQERASNSLYQTYICIDCKDSYAILSKNRFPEIKDDDLQSVGFLYNDCHEFAVGHQTSVNWNPKNDSDVYIGMNADTKDNPNVTSSMIPKNNIQGDFKDKCKMVETTFFPEYHMRTMDFSLDDVDLNMYDLSDEGLFIFNRSKKERNIQRLKNLADKYKDWIEDNYSASAQKKYRTWDHIFQRHHHDCIKSLSRIREGIKLLKNGDEDVYHAFCLMNRAIWLNWINKRQSKKNEGTYVVKLNDKKSGSWRAFQMAFILQNLCSIVDWQHPDRDIVDLLWVPTGGGKTEAYLGLLAFTMFLKRIKKEKTKEDGVEVMMRYTLRLLTIQQFQRATRLIMACEYIRKIDDYPILHDCEPFSIGLYVGQNTTPNRITTEKIVEGYDNDYDIYEKVYKKDPKNNWNLEYCGRTAEYAIIHWQRKKLQKESENPVQLIICPWCGYRFTGNDYMLHREKKSITIRCGNPKCPFHRHDLPIPVKTVDETILNNPPSLLIGTVDKFAQLPFNPAIGHLFGWWNGRQLGNPPNLIVQDELHLINGPLGSMIGLYEASIDYLTTVNVASDDIGETCIDELNPKKMKVTWDSKAKFIASTATIRNATRQCRSLYNRGTSKFPAPGINISDSFFVRQKNNDIDDKAYVGIYCAGIGMKTSIKRGISKILCEVSYKKDKEVEIDDYDNYWTIVSYYNSRRELGSSVTLMRDDIRTNVENIRPSILSEESIGELHGGLNSTELPNVLERLELRSDKENPSTYDIILCTNMFSVGIDIDRLGLMVMNCQPKATTEYLQSTGRVGRTGEGLIFVLFNQARPRDQSHFERFYDYHSRVHSHVESMTVTPYSEGCIDRALHAQYVTLMRIALPQSNMISIKKNTNCINFSEEHRDHDISKRFCLYLLQRARETENKSNLVWKTVLDSLTEFHSEWLTRKDAAIENPSVKSPRGELKSQLIYSQRSPVYQRKHPRLLEQDPASPWFESRKREQYNYHLAPILTPNSLRNVEEEVNYIFLWKKRW